MTIKTLVIASSWRAYKNCLHEKGLDFRETKYISHIMDLFGWRNVRVIKYGDYYNSAIYIKNTKEEVNQRIKMILF